MVYYYREWYEKSFPGGVYARNLNHFLESYYGAALYRNFPLYDGFFWPLAEAVSGDPSRIDIPMLHVSGWYDHATPLTVREMRAVQEAGGPSAAGRQKLLIGPWSHSRLGARGQHELEYSAAEYADSLEAIAFFDTYLRGLDTGWESRAAVRYFQTNEDRWVECDEWPPPYTTPVEWFLRADGSLVSTPPEVREAFRSYVSDPADPVPSVCGALLEFETDGAQGPGDLRVLESRPDVLTFTSPPAELPLVIAGNPRVHLWLQCDAVDTDLAVRLTQVYPDGRSMGLTDGIRRASLRNGFSDKEPLQPQGVYPVTVDLPPLAATLPPGHALRLLIMPSNYDRFDVNMQDGSDLSDAQGATAAAASVALFADAPRPSRLELPVVWASRVDSDGDGLPDVFEAAHFGGHTNALPHADSDGDGHSNEAEYIAGTRPTAADSAFRVTSWTDAGRVIAGFQTIPSSGPGYEGRRRVYTLASSTTLDADVWDPVDGYADLSADGRTVRYTNAAPDTVRFLRGEVSLRAD